MSPRFAVAIIFHWLLVNVFWRSRRSNMTHTPHAAVVGPRPLLFCRVLASEARLEATCGGASRRLTRAARHKSALAVSTETDAQARKYRSARVSRFRSFLPRPSG